VEGVQIFGGIGAGKTSGSGATLARKYLQHGFGGLVLTVKTDEKDTWVEYCQQSGRGKDLILLEPNGAHSFDFLDYEQNRTGRGAGLTGNIVNLLKTVIQAGQSDAGQRTNEGFWEDALDMLLFNTVDLAVLAYERLKIDDLYNIVQLLYKERAHVVRPTEESDDPFAQILYRAKLNTAKRAERNKQEFLKRHPDKTYDVTQDNDLRQFKRILHYFTSDFPGLSDRTRSVIEHSFWGLLFRLIREPIRGMLCSASPTITPDDSLNGKIILMNLPVKLYDKVGRDAQILFKYVWQRAMERRDLSHNSRPLFLWADEAQNFLHEHDIDYQATARSSRVCTVYLTQNLPNYFAHLGGRSGEYRVKSFLGTMGTKIFHANADMETNKYAADLIGKQEIWTKSESQQFVGGMSMSESIQQTRDHIVHPEEVARMKTGGPVNNFAVDARIHRQGLPWFSTERNDRLIRFKQQHKPKTNRG